MRPSARSAGRGLEPQRLTCRIVAIGGGDAFGTSKAGGFALSSSSSSSSF